jgi:hypothetical protein
MRHDSKAAAGRSPPDRKTNRINAMTQMEINSLEAASRSVLAWSPEGYDGRVHLGAVFGALVSALGILAAAAALLFVAF